MEHISLYEIYYVAIPGYYAAPRRAASPVSAEFARIADLTACKTQPFASNYMIWAAIFGVSGGDCQITADSVL